MSRSYTGRKDVLYGRKAEPMTVFTVQKDNAYSHSDLELWTYTHR